MIHNFHLKFSQVCSICKQQVVKFSEFSHIVEEQQKFFDVKPKIDIACIEEHDVAEPEAKKLKTDHTTEFSDSDNVTDYETVQEEIKHETSRPSQLNVRRKSVTIQQSTSTEKVSKLITTVDA